MGRGGGDRVELQSESLLRYMPKDVRLRPGERPGSESEGSFANYTNMYAFAS